MFCDGTHKTLPVEKADLNEKTSASAVVIAARVPIKVDVEAGKDYWFCTCGRSETQPFCDGSHSGTEFAPLLWTAEKSEAKWFCQVC